MLQEISNNSLASHGYLANGVTQISAEYISEASSTKKQSPSILDSHHNYHDISKNLVVNLTLPLKTAKYALLQMCIP